MKIKYIFSLFSKMKTCRTGQCSNTKTAFLPLLIIGFLSLGSVSLIGQSCSDGEVTYCYDDNETTEITYCPDDPITQKIVVSVSAFSSESNIDFLNIYDGTGTGGTLLEQLSGTLSSINTYTATAQAEGGDGCLTFNIVSNASNSCNSGAFPAGAKWDVSCQIHCTPPTAVLMADMTEICSTDADNQATGVSVNFDASASMPTTGGSLTSYEWHFGDGTIQTTATPTIDYTYSASGGYSAFLIVTDSLGCNSTNLAEQFIQLSGAPTFNISSDASVSGVCQGESFNLTGNSTPYSWMEQIQQSIIPPTTEISHQPGPVFASSAYFTQFVDGDTIRDGTNLTITVNMKHPYMGDLLMYLVCPDGTRVALISAPNLMDSGDTGTASGFGLDYTFSMSAATFFNSNTYVGGTTPSGSYKPDGDFADIDGCPINGEWKLEISNRATPDYGDLFSWEITLSGVDESERVLESFTNNYPTAVWTGDGVTGTTATPTTEGLQPYTYTVIDNFGCEYSESLNVTVLSSGDPACNDAPVITSSNSFTILENSMPIIDVQSIDDSDSEGNGISYSFAVNGVDNQFFMIDSDDGEIRLDTAFNYEIPVDAGANNRYNIAIEVCDIENACSTQMITVSVIDVDEDNDGYVNIADPDDNDPCNPDPQEGACQQDCNGQAPTISGN